jgi:hypothetical protein
LLRVACRLALAATCLALLALWVEPHWRPDSRTLELRLRRGPEVLKAAHSVATRAWSEVRDRDLPAVSGGTERTGPEVDELTDEDRRLLERLLEEKLRE